MSFFEELKRRNVIRIAIAYGVASWFLLQLGDVVLENLDAPESVMRYLIITLVICFPVVVILAWALEWTPEGIKKEKDVDRSASVAAQTGRKLDRAIIGILTIVVGFLLIDKLILQDSPTTRGEAGREFVINNKDPQPSGPSVAVLPFVNMSDNKENEYFSDGLTETLLHMLSQLPELRVAARTSSFAFKDRDTSIAEIASTLGVAHILEGSVQRDGDRVRVTAQLIRAADGFHVWSQNYTRPMEDIFAIQDEIAADVANALDASLLGHAIPDLKGVATSDLTAYDNYLKGLALQANYSYGGLNIAEDHFKLALARDPEFTDARLALIRNYLLKNNTGLLDEAELRALAEPLIAQVREQHPDNRLARAFELLINLLNRGPDQGRVEIEAMVTELRNMLPLIPNEVLVRSTVAGFLNGFSNQHQDAVEVLEAGLLLDPLAAELHRTLGNIYMNQERLEEAMESLQRSLELDPKNPNTYSNIGNLEKEKNNLTLALNWGRMSTEVDPQDHELATMLAQDLYALKLPEEGDRWYARVNALVPGSAIARMVELNRAVARDDYEYALKLAQSMISDQVPTRQGAFAQALVSYVELMFRANMAREAYDFLLSVRPETANYDVLPDDNEGLIMQWASIILMSGFEDPEKQKEAWLKLSANMDNMGRPWRDPEGGILIFDLVILGDYEAAVEHYLKDRLSRPFARNLLMHRRLFEPLLGPVYNDPRVAARLSELDKEYKQLRKDVSALMLEPEWNQ
jgi:adenylate cyclase